MGGFQAVAAGLGNAGNSIGEGQDAAAKTAMQFENLRQQWAATQADTALKQQQLAQTYTIAQQQHDLARQQLIASGWKDLGPVVNPDGSYSRQFQNIQTGESKVLPIQGVAPDSPQGLGNYFRQLQSMTDDKGKPVFNTTQAAQIAYKMPQLYREGPAGMLESFRDDAQDLVDSGVSKVKGPLGQTIDISTPQGRNEYAEANLDLVYGRSGYMHYGLNNFTGGSTRDMTGFTPGEKREFDAASAPLKMQENMLLSQARIELANAFTPDQQTAVMAKYTPQIQQIEDQINGIFNNIKGRRATNIANTSGLPDFIKQMTGSAATGPSGGQPTIPPSAMAQLKKGVITTFGNGQQWTLDPNGQPKLVGGLGAH